ncbi:MAG: hypothetical protein LBQ97_08110 [Fusobacteriaceae bacterium]|jgi:antitoxin component of RelBE/YafQ-DinJ toxin-antitoxin module|nr:hypothetical protein [Fusobacteriaceae bacterium]
MKSINIRLNEDLLADLKHIAETYHETLSGLARTALEKIVQERKADFYYRLMNVPECSKEESEELLEILNSMTEEELKIAKVKSVIF